MLYHNTWYHKTAPRPPFVMSLHEAIPHIAAKCASAVGGVGWRHNVVWPHQLLYLHDSFCSKLKPILWVIKDEGVYFVRCKYLTLHIIYIYIAPHAVVSLKYSLPEAYDKLALPVREASLENSYFLAAWNYIIHTLIVLIFFPLTSVLKPLHSWLLGLLVISSSPSPSQLTRKFMVCTGHRLQMFMHPPHKP